LDGPGAAGSCCGAAAELDALGIDAAEIDAAEIDLRGFGAIF
jgi:hypothetical protein